MSVSFSKMLPPVPVDAETIRQIKAKAKETRLSQADVVRQSLRLGLPQLEISAPMPRRRPKCLDWIDQVPPLDISARDIKKLLKERIAKRNGFDR
jgi:hypothetical protein